MTLLQIAVEFARFVMWPLAPMLLAWPAWSLRIRRQRKQARRERVRRGNARRNPTALR